MASQFVDSSDSEDFEGFTAQEVGNAAERHKEQRLQGLRCAFSSDFSSEESDDEENLPLNQLANRLANEGIGSDSDSEFHDCDSESETGMIFSCYSVNEHSVFLIISYLKYSYNIVIY